MKIKQAIPLICSILASVAGFILMNPMLFNICMDTYIFNGQLGCLDDSSDSIGYPLFIFSLFTASVSLFIIFVKEKVFYFWTKFSIFWISLSLLLLAFIDDRGGALGPNLYDISRSTAAFFAGGLFALISFGIIIWTYLKSRKNRAID